MIWISVFVQLCEDFYCDRRAWLWYSSLCRLCSWVSWGAFSRWNFGWVAGKSARSHWDAFVCLNCEYSDRSSVRVKKQIFDVARCTPHARWTATHIAGKHISVGVDQDKLRPPEKLNSSHQIEGFDSGNSQLDDWIKRRALKNELDGASRTYVFCAGEVVIAYYCLANGAVSWLSSRMHKTG